MLIGDRSPKCFKVVSLKAGQVRQFTCAKLRTKVGKESMTFRGISLSVAARPDCSPCRSLVAEKLILR